MQSEAEADVVVGIAGHIEPVRLVKRLRIPVGGVLYQVHHVASRQGLAPQLHLISQGADLHFGRPVESQDLLDPRLDQRWIVSQPLQLIGVLEKHPHAVADQVGGGLVAPEQEQHAIGHDLGIFQAVVAL